MGETFENFPAVFTFPLHFKNILKQDQISLQVYGQNDRKSHVSKRNKNNVNFQLKKYDFLDLFHV